MLYCIIHYITDKSHNFSMTLPISTMGSSCLILRAAQSTGESVTLKAQYTCVWPHENYHLSSSILAGAPICVCVFVCYMWVEDTKKGNSMHGGTQIDSCTCVQRGAKSLNYGWKQHCSECKITGQICYRVYCVLMDVIERRMSEAVFSPGLWCSTVCGATSGLQLLMTSAPC